MATISAHNDPAIGEMVARAIEKVGAEGAVTVEEAKGTETTIDIVEGEALATLVVNRPRRARGGRQGPHQLNANAPDGWGR